MTGYNRIDNISWTDSMHTGSFLGGIIKKMCSWGKRKFCKERKIAEREKEKEIKDNIQIYTLFMNKILWGTCFYPNDSPPPARCGVAFYSKRANINVIDGRTDILKYGNSWKFLSGVVSATMPRMLETRRERSLLEIHCFRYYAPLSYVYDIYSSRVCTMIL